MKILYIGQYTNGTTSKMRANQLEVILNPSRFKIIDTHQPFFKTFRIWRSIGFRYKKGPLIRNINLVVIKQLATFTNEKFELIWVDKAVFLTKKTTSLLRKKTEKLVHFTPDPAFTFHQSSHFTASLKYYDYAITTKPFELSFYQNHLPENKIILTTQGFNPIMHRPKFVTANKVEGVLFIGHYEKEREVVLQQLLNARIHVGVAGINWEKFAKKNKENSHFTFLGCGIYGSDYAKAISSYQFSWGALSKWIPELHTTRTFEIPACGTALITERNSETSSFFTEEEAVFYDNPEEMIIKIKYYQNHPDKLELLIKNGRDRVIKDGRDYKTIIEGLLKKIGFVEY